MTEDATTTKAHLLARMAEAYAALRTALDRLPPEALEQPGTWGEWSLKDLIAHLAYWQTSAIERVQTYVAGEVEAALALQPGGAAGSEDEINAGVYRANRDRPLAEMLETLDVTYLTLRTTAKSVPTALLNNEELPVRFWLAGNSYEHYEEHLPAIERAVQSQSTG